jgi:hypothetical protein
VPIYVGAALRLIGKLLRTQGFALKLTVGKPSPPTAAPGRALQSRGKLGTILDSGAKTNR